MAFISSKFNMPSKSGSGLNNQDYCDLFLTNLKNAFIAANNAWSQVGSIETIGTNTNTSYGCRTLQLKSSVSNKYVRIWKFAASANIGGSFVDSPDTSGGYNALKLYRGNVMRVNGNDAILTDTAGHGGIWFGVSDNSIDVDFAKDLGLSVSLFCLSNSVRDTNSFNANFFSDDNYNNGATYSVVTDGKYFGLMQWLSDKNYITSCFYAPDMMICANSGDTNTEGVISCEGYTDSFYFGNNNAYDAEGYIKVLFNAADGTHDFRGWTEGIYNGKDGCMTAENATDMSCTALKVFLNIQNYSGSTMEGVIDGINLKGWVNPDYMRSASITVLPAASKNMTYGLGAWLCTDAGTLICWDDSNSSPFEAAT